MHLLRMLPDKDTALPAVLNIAPIVLRMADANDRLASMNEISAAMNACMHNICVTCHVKAIVASGLRALQRRRRHCRLGSQFERQTLCSPYVLHECTVSVHLKL